MACFEINISSARPGDKIRQVTNRKPHPATLLMGLAIQQHFTIQNQQLNTTLYQFSKQSSARLQAL